MPMLHGVKVLDLSRVIAGPFCSRMLGDLGAEIIKIESPRGDATRQASPRKGDYSAPFTQFNAGKKSVCIDGRSSKGVTLIKALAAQCEVFLENYRAGLANEIGLGYADIKASNPRIIYCSISGFGQLGPDTSRPAYTDIIQAMSGLDYAAQQMYGNPDQQPPGYPVSLADTCTALNAAIAILAALYHREQTGEGQYIDMSMLDATIASNDSTLQRYLFSDGELDAPSTIYRPPLKLADGFMAASIGLNFDKSMRAIGRADLIDDERFKTPQLQRQNMADYIDVVKKWAAHKTVSEVSACFDEYDIPFGKVCTSQEVVNSPLVQDREMLVDLDLPNVGVTPVLNTPFNFSRGKSRPSGPPPALGQHTREVLTALLDLPAHEYEHLLDSGIVWQGESP